MRTHWRLIALLAVSLLGYGMLLRAFHLMNQPSDRALYGGLGIIFSLIVLAPIVIRAIWRVL